MTKDETLQHWTNMPEFIQDKQIEHAKIIIRFDNEEDLQNFAKLIDQKLTNKTKSIWFPFKSHYRTEKKVYVSEE